MNRATLAATAIVLVPLLAYPLVTIAGGAPRFPTREECIHPPVDGQQVDVVFGRFDSPQAAAGVRDEVISVGFVGTGVLPDGCGRWKVVLDGVPSIDVGREIQDEAQTVDLHPTLELASDG
jgi:hypothetical protein